MKLIIVLTILYYSIYQNNSNYFVFQIDLYLYFAKTKIKAIIFLNHLGFSISYNMLYIKF